LLVSNFGALWRKTDNLAFDNDNFGNFGFLLKFSSELIIYDYLQHDRTIQRCVKTVISYLLFVCNVTELVAACDLCAMYYVYAEFYLL